MKWNFSWRSQAVLLVAFMLCASVGVQAQSNAVSQVQSGSKVFLEINAQQLRNELDMLMSGLSSVGGGDWNAILTNGSNPGMDVDFSGYDAKGIEDLIATGTVTADSLVLNKDASVTGRLAITGVTTVNDSLKATGYVTFSDSLEVVRAVSVGQTLFVTGVTSLGDSLHVVGNVDLDAMLNVDGAVNFGSTLAVTGQTTLNDSLHAMGAAEFALNVEVGQHLYVDSVRSLNTDGVSISANSKVALAADSMEASFEQLSFVGRYDNDTQGRIALEMSSAGDSPFNEYDGVFYAEHGEARSHLMFDIDEDEDDADIEIMAEATNNDIEYGKASVYAESEGDHADVGMEIFAEDLSNGRWSEGEIEVDIDSDDGAADLHIRLLENNIQAELAFDRATWDSPTDVALKSSEGKVRVYAGDDVVIRAGGMAKIEMAADEDSIAIHANAIRFEQGNVTIAENASISGSLSTTGLSVVNVIDGQVNSLGNFTSDALLEGDSNLYFSAAERTLLASMASTLDSLIAVIDGLGGTSEPASVPTVVTSAATDVAEEAATLNGSIDSDGGDAVTASGFRWGQTANLSDAQDLAGSGTSGAFTGSLTGLTAGTTYYFTAFATNGEGTAYGDTLSFETTAAAAGFVSCGDNVTYQGYDYATVQIGSQCWFAENLQSTSYNDESLIASGLDNAAWSTTTEGAVSTYDDNEANVATHGRLYNWWAVNSGKLCPTGWHVPSNSEWSTLSDGLGGNSLSGVKLKASSPDWDGTNESGFAGLPSGTRRGPNGLYAELGGSNGWWTSTSLLSGTGANSWQMWTGFNEIYNQNPVYNTGWSVRCVQD